MNFNSVRPQINGQVINKSMRCRYQIKKNISQIVIDKIENNADLQMINDILFHLIINNSRYS